ncbi:OsmC family protein [Diaminobutyricimonas sp. TR449]|uniref:OsmC family protein n=1 Tax=Diaminobutyricimonas sp. TR449 TaxID=2708076 RepID=UPI00142491A0|nr:OsmC family protein [Diaminobutyricimonas sp. TR449]
MDQERIASAITRVRETLAEHAETYRDSAATATLEAGLRVKVAGPDGEFMVTDMSAGVGGEGTAPSPGWIFRSAVASCVATLIAMRAAEEGVELPGLKVMVDSESDDRGLLGIGEVAAGPLSMRVIVRVQSTSDDAKVREIIEWGTAHCPVWDAVERAVPGQLTIELAGP